MCRAIVLDTETTGFDKPQVIELAYQMLSDDLSEIKEGFFCERFKPSKQIEKGALKVHGINEKSLKHKTPSKDLLRSAPKVLTTKYIIGHHISYDIGAIKHSTKTNHNFKTICTKRLALEVLKNQPSYRLVSLSNNLNLVDKDTIDKAHSADADVYMTTKLLQHIKAVLEESTGRVYTLDDLFYLSARLQKKSHNSYIEKSQTTTS